MPWIFWVKFLSEIISLQIQLSITVLNNSRNMMNLIVRYPEEPTKVRTVYELLSIVNETIRHDVFI